MNSITRTLFLMMVCADSFLLQETCGAKPKPELAGGKPTGRIAHTLTQNEGVIHFEDHDVHVSFTNI